MNAQKYIQNNLTALALNGTLEKIIDAFNKNEGNTITPEIQWMINRCDNTHDVKVFKGTLPYRMVAKLRKLPVSYIVFGDNIVYMFRLSFGQYVSNQNTIYFSYESMTFTEFFGV